MKKAALYIRVSTHYQVDKDSLPFQRQELINYCKYVLEIDDYVIFEDAGFSGKNMQRPQLQLMMRRIRSGEFSHLLVWKIDRISRNLLDFCDMYEELKKYNVAFISKNEQFDTSSAMGEAMLKIILIFAELERKLTAERVKAIMLSRAEKGFWNGAKVPFGYDYDETTKKLKINKHKAELIKFIFNLYLKKKSTGEVKCILEEKKIPTPTGKERWNSKVVGDIIKNPVYIGTYRYNHRESARGKIKPKDEWIIKENNHEAIIDENVFKKANTLIKSNAGLMSRRTKHNHIHIFSNIIVCPSCNRSYVAYPDAPRKDGYSPSRYRCYTYVHSKKSYTSCSNTIGEINVGPFFIKLLKNLITALDNLNNGSSYEKIESDLLKGEIFEEIESINFDGINQLLLQLDINKSEKIKNETVNLQLKKREKLLRAIERLENLYLFSDEAISEKDYIIKKTVIENQLTELDAKFEEEYKQK